MQAGYFATSWADIKNSPRWLGKLCLLGLIMFIPVFGPIVLYGYAYGWGRDMAWNVHNPLPERIFGNEDGRLYSRGFFVLVIVFVFMLVLSMVSGMLGALLGWGDGFFGAILGFALFVADVALAIGAVVFSWVGSMRTSIYGRLSAGFQVKKIWSMMRQDPSGIMRIFAMNLLFGLVLSAIAMAIMTVIALAFLALFAIVAPNVDVESLFDMMFSSRYVFGRGSEEQLMAFGGAALALVGIASIAGLAISYVMSVLQVFITLVTARALGYWTRQFDVAQWRGQDDPMPFELGQRVGQPATQSYAQQSAAQAQAQYAQARAEYVAAQQAYEQQQAAQRAYEQQRKQEAYEQAYYEAAAAAGAADESAGLAASAAATDDAFSDAPAGHHGADMSADYPSAGESLDHPSADAQTLDLFVEAHAADALGDYAAALDAINESEVELFSFEGAADTPGDGAALVDINGGDGLGGDYAFGDVDAEGGFGSARTSEASEGSDVAGAGDGEAHRGAGWRSASNQASDQAGGQIEDQANDQPNDPPSDE